MKETIISKIEKENIDEEVLKKAGKIIEQGGLVIFPTETVYGIGADFKNEESTSNIYKAKGRPSDNPLIVHISKLKDVEKIGKNISEDTRKLMKAFWPGPITFILDKASNVPDSITGGLDTVAVRMPSDLVARKIIEYSKTFIAAPSANISGKPSITNEEFLVDEFNLKVDMIILSKDSSIGIESTVIDARNGKNRILRPGFITKENIEMVLKKEISFDNSILDKNEKPLSPGMKYKHYSPNCDVYIVYGNLKNKIKKVNKKIQEDKENNLKSLVLCKKKFKKFLKNSMSIGENEKDIAHNIFYILRLLDKKNVDKAYILDLSDNGMYFSIMDRLKKASGYKRI